jgi:hypothetical protein
LRDAFLAGMWVPISALVLAAIATFLLPSVAQVAAHKTAAVTALEAEEDARQAAEGIRVV